MQTSQQFNYVTSITTKDNSVRIGKVFNGGSLGQKLRIAYNNEFADIVWDCLICYDDFVDGFVRQDWNCRLFNDDDLFMKLDVFIKPTYCPTDCFDIAHIVGLSFALAILFCWCRNCNINHISAL